MATLPGPADTRRSTFKSRYTLSGAPVILRRKWSARAGVVAAAVVPGYMVHLAYNADDPLLPWGPVRAGLVGGFIGLLAWRASAIPCVVVSADRITIFGPLSRADVALRDIAYAEGNGGLAIHLKDGRSEYPWAFSSSLLDMGRSRRAADEINAAVESAHAREVSSESCRGMSRSLTLPWK